MKKNCFTYSILSKYQDNLLHNIISNFKINYSTKKLVYLRNKCGVENENLCILPMAFYFPCKALNLSSL